MKYEVKVRRTRRELVVFATDLNYFAYLQVFADVLSRYMVKSQQNFTFVVALHIEEVCPKFAELCGNNQKPTQLSMIY